MEGLQKKIDTLLTLIKQVQDATMVEINVDIDKITDINEENEEYFYTLFVMNDEEVKVVLEDASYETAFNYLKGILIGYEYCILRHLHSLCRN